MTWRCYGDLGCLSIGGAFYHPLYRPINFFPEERWVVNTEFLVFTRQNPRQQDSLSWNSTVEQISLSHFNASRPTKIITHGWLDTVFFGAWLKEMKTAFLLVGDYNVIIVDWRGGNGLPYTQATANTRLVGAEIAAFIKKLQAVFGAEPESFHILGHSLGSHIAGYAGLDPAEPYFQKMPAEVRLDPTDAEFVDVVHTDGASFVLDILKGEGLGMYDPVGHVDFYPNGGIKMPGCEFSTRVFKFVTEGLVNAFHYLVNLEMLNNPGAGAASGDLILKLEGTRDNCDMKINRGSGRTDFREAHSPISVLILWKCTLSVIFNVRCLPPVYVQHRGLLMEFNHRRSFHNICPSPRFDDWQ
ncbi:hypothetical protein HPB50_000570 [Hyalomma asiaticum]|uniref:Uncharacterized protein n=1 Tax=Hyalomma asiaticum TaxID=266040 RepID=A0ACB7T3H7_HYAAI|nr:hypothetical protein HPB50_000570 [Hyalomma asiaticum]